MEKAELITSLITTAITATSIIFIWLIQFIIKKFIGQTTSKKDSESLSQIVNFVLEAEQKLGKGQGQAKLMYVLSKLNKKPKDKKTIKKINEVHSTLNIADEINEAKQLNKKINDSNL